MRRMLGLIPLLVLALARPVAAQVPAPTVNALDAGLRSVLVARTWASERLGLTAWLDGGRRLVEVAPDGSLTATDSTTGQVETLATRTQLTPSGGEVLDIEDVSFSSDARRILIFTSSRTVWRDNTRGDYWVFDRTSRRLRQVAPDAPPSSLMFAKLSPDGTRVAYVRAQNLYVEEVANGKTTALTRDGGGDIINGTSDWVTEEEWGLRDAFAWSPDGTRLLYWRFDTTGVGRYTLLDTLDRVYPTIRQFPYPKAGTTNSAVRVGVISATGGTTTWLRVDGDPRQQYIPRAAWRDAGHITLSVVARRQNEAWLVDADARSGAVRVLASERNQAWVDMADPLAIDEARPAWTLPDGQLTFLSDRDGWRHVYAVSPGGGDLRLLTRFEADAMTIAGLDAASSTLYVVASSDEPTRRYLYAADLRTGAVRRVTPAGLPGTHSYTIAPDGRSALHTWSAADTPPRTELVSLPDHRTIRTLVANTALLERAATLQRNPVEFTRVALQGGITLDASIVRPSDFEQTRQYPVLAYVYTEPADTTVDDAWSQRTLLHRAFADAGYVVVSIESQGTAVPRGGAWRKAVYGSIGDLASRQQAEGLRALAATRPWMDLSRVGVYGHSGGGSAVLNALFRFPDLYGVGISLAPVTDLRLYDTVYEERYMGLPQENPDGYRRGSPITFAEGLRGRLLLVHGTADDNVHIQGTEQLIDRLIALGKDVDQQFYPGRTHGLSERGGTTLHLWRLIARYLTEHVPAGPRAR